MNVKHKILTASILASSILLVPAQAIANSYNTTAGVNLKTSTGAPSPQDIIVGDTNPAAVLTPAAAFPTIEMDQAGKLVSNFATITGTGTNNAIKVTTAASLSLTNNVGGKINQTGTESAVLVSTGGTLTKGIFNSGTIEHNNENTKFAVQIADSFTQLTNNQGGLIQNTFATGKAISVTALAIGNLTNAGSIKAGKNAIEVIAALTGKITNTGTISTTAGDAISLTSTTLGVYNNAGGTISGVGGSAVSTNAINDVSNSGTLQADTTAVVAIGAVDSMISNNTGGLIKGTANNVMGILFNGAGNHSLVNNGTITTTGLGSSAVQNITGPSTGSIVNNTNGIISVDNGAIAIDDQQGFSGGGITNTGRIDAGITGTAIKIGNGLLTNVTHSGAIVGKVLMGAGVLTINNGGSIAGDISRAFLTGSATLNFNVGTGSFTTGGLIDSIDNINVNSGNITINHPVGSVTPAVSFGLTAGTLNLNANVFSTDFNNTGGVLALNKMVTDTGNFSQTGGTLQITVMDKNNFGQLNVTNKINMTPASKLSVVVPAGSASNIMNADFFDVVKVGGTVTADAAVFVPYTDLFLSFTKGVAPNGKDIRLTANRRSFSSVMTSGDLLGVGGALDSILNSPPVDPTFRAVLDQMASFSNTADLNKFVRTLISGTSNSIFVASTGSYIKASQLMSARLASLLVMNDTDTPDAGYAAGSAGENGMWVQAFGVNANQKVRKGIPGYDADTMGAIIGVDSHFGPCLVLGFAGSYGFTDMDTKNGSRNNAKVRSYQGTAYGAFNLAQSYIDASLTYGRMDSQTLRNIAVGATNFRAVADFDGNQYGARIAYTMPTSSGAVRILPSLSVSWLRSIQEAYTERNAGVLALRVQKQHNSVLEFGAGAQFEYPIRSEYGVFVPQFEVNVKQDILGQVTVSRNNFVGGGAPFVVRGPSVSRTTLDTGVGFNMIVSDEISFKANYNAAFKKNFFAQTGSLTVRYSF